MKKIVLNFENISGNEFSRGEDAIATVLAKLSFEKLKTLVTTVNEMIEIGDIWFIHDQLTEDSKGSILTFILDSAEATDNFIEKALVFFTEAGLGNHEIVSLTFEEFATFASENEETKFDPYATFELG
jgi:hypothetical protein